MARGEEVGWEGRKDKGRGRGGTHFEVTVDDALGRERGKRGSEEKGCDGMESKRERKKAVRGGEKEVRGRKRSSREEGDTEGKEKEVVGQGEGKDNEGKEEAVRGKKRDREEGKSDEGKEEESSERKRQRNKKKSREGKEEEARRSRREARAGALRRCGLMEGYQRRKRDGKSEALLLESSLECYRSQW